MKYPGLTKAVHPKNRHEYMDQDYVAKLSPEEKQWLSNFNEEYLSGNFRHPGKILHKSKKSKRGCYTNNNARNRCLYSVSMANKLMEQVPVLETYKERVSANPDMVENAIVDIIDYGLVEARKLEKDGK